ncbi:MAG: LPS-assembly protein LptD [Deltaproteobacteria bacterium]|nr:LPS-assembly protein LptD [Deltaproteobacteria bacterium]
MRKRSILFFMSLSLLLCGDLSLASVPDMPKRVDIEAETLSYDSDSETYQASGNVIISFEGGFIKADTVILDRLKDEATAEGHVFIKSGEDLLEGEKAHFSIANETGIVSDGKMFFDKNHLYLWGETIEKRGDATYFLKEGRATTCDGGNPDWVFTGSEVEVTIDGYGTVKDGTFQVRGVPILYLPYMIFPAKTTRQTGLLFPRISYSSDKLGMDVSIPFYWAVSESADATFYQRYMDKRGFQEGVEFRYLVSEDSYGTLYGDYLNDAMKISKSEEDPFLRRDWNANHKRWSYYLDHETTFSPGFYLKTDIKRVSDKWYFRDFDSYNYYMEHYSANYYMTDYEEDDAPAFKGVSFKGDKSMASLISTARLVKEWNLFNATALVEYTDNFQSYSNDETLQKYPEVSFIGLQQPIFDSPFDFELTSSYGYYYRTTGYRGDAFDAYPVVSWPLTFGDYLEFTPSLGVRETTWTSSYDGTVTGNEDRNGSRELYTTGATLSSEAQRIFEVGGKVVDKIQHAIRPEVEYSYIPYVYQDDRPDFLDEVAETNKVTYSLINTLIARLNYGERGSVYREFFRLKLSQDYDIKEARRDTTGSLQPRRPFGNITSELDVNPFQYFSLDSDTDFNISSGEWEKINSSVRISDPREDSLTVQYRYTKNSVEEINLSLKAKATKTLDLMYTLRKDELDRKTLETTYALNYHKQCWSVEVSYSHSPDDTSYMFIFSLYGLGKVGRVSGPMPGR